MKLNIFLLLISTLSFVDSHTINCQTNSSVGNNMFISTSELTSPSRNLVVFRNCESYADCSQCTNCGVCELVEDSQNFHKIYFPSDLQTIYLMIILTNTINSELYCNLQNINNNTNYELSLLGCSISTCTQNNFCGTCTLAGCSYCPTYGCVSGSPSGCQTYGCCNIYSTCNDCSLNSDCQWCNSKQCKYKTEKCDRSETNSTCLTPSTYDFDPNNLIKMNSKVLGKKISFWNGTLFNPQFLAGVDIGVSLPSKSPGDLQTITYDQWFRLLQLSLDLGVNTIRVYTLLPPQFYEAFRNFNLYSTKFLYLFQGVWSPLDGISNIMVDAWNPIYVNKFSSSIIEVVNALHGNVSIPFRYGEAYGLYNVDVTKWLGGFILGTEWDPEIVSHTNSLNTSIPQMTYFQLTPDASKFEAWLAYMMDLTAIDMMLYNSQAPIAFTNWVSTDDLNHPLEPYKWEDEVELDPTHILSNYGAGMFSSIHAYPYYPDSLRFEYTNCKSCEGSCDSFSGYLRELRRKHHNMPIIISEFGLSTSRVSAHDGPLRRNQGGLTEQEQADKVSELIKLIFDEDLDGGFVFALENEWFKRCWTSMHMEIPDTRQLWINRLAAEEFFGLVSMDPFVDINVDGSFSDWIGKSYTAYTNYMFNTYVLSNEAELFIMLEKNSGNWSLSGGNDVIIGFDVINGGYPDNLTFYLKKLNNRQLSFQNLNGTEFVLHIDSTNPRYYVNNQYDPFIYKYGLNGEWSLPLGTERNFEDFRMALSYALDSRNFSLCPEPFTYLDSFYNVTMSDFKINGKYLELRVVWNFLGSMDPSQHLVWKYPTSEERFQNITIKNRHLNPITSTNIKFEVQTRIGGTKFNSPLMVHNWNSWTENHIQWTERLKPSYHSYRDTIGNLTLRTCESRQLNCKNFIKAQCLTANEFFGVTFPTNVRTILHPNVPGFYNSSTQPVVMRTFGFPNITQINVKLLSNSFLVSTNGFFYRINKYLNPDDLRMNETLILVGGATVLSPNQNLSGRIIHYLDSLPTSSNTTSISSFVNSTAIFSNITSLLNHTRLKNDLLTLFVPLPTPNNIIMMNLLCNTTIFCQRLFNCHLVSDIWYRSGMFNGITLQNFENKNIFTSLLNITSGDLTNSNGVIHFVNDLINCV